MASSSLFFDHLPPLLLVQILLCFTLASSEPPLEEKQALLTFINNVPLSKRLVWNTTASPCNWVGVQCDLNSTHVVSFRLPAAGLVGAIPPSTIGRLAGLRILSLRSNRLSGGLPPDFANFTSLHSLYLQSNTFSGEFPGQLAGLVRLTRLDLSSNGFVGEVPAAINNLTSLTGLFLENNRFNGVLPNISIGSLTSFDVSNNNLTGAIPAVPGVVLLRQRTALRPSPLSMQIAAAATTKTATAVFSNSGDRHQAVPNRLHHNIGRRRRYPPPALSPRRALVSHPTSPPATEWRSRRHLHLGGENNGEGEGGRGLGRELRAGSRGSTAATPSWCSSTEAPTPSTLRTC